MRVLVKEKIGDSGVQLLRDAGFDVELGVDWDDGELARRIGEFDAILIRSATTLTAELLERADHLKAVGRAGVGVDNVDVDAATKRGVRLGDVAREGDQEADGVLRGRGDCRLRCVGDDDSATRGRLDVDVVHPHPGPADHLQAVGPVDQLGGELRRRPDQDAVVAGDPLGQLVR